MGFRQGRRADDDRLLLLGWLLDATAGCVIDDVARRWSRQFHLIETRGQLPDGRVGIVFRQRASGCWTGRKTARLRRMSGHHFLVLQRVLQFFEPLIGRLVGSLLVRVAEAAASASLNISAAFFPFFFGRVA